MDHWGEILFLNPIKIKHFEEKLDLFSTVGPQSISRHERSPKHTNNNNNKKKVKEKTIRPNPEVS